MNLAWVLHHTRQPRRLAHGTQLTCRGAGFAALGRWLLRRRRRRVRLLLLHRHRHPRLLLLLHHRRHDRLLPCCLLPIGPAWGRARRAQRTACRQRFSTTLPAVSSNQRLPRHRRQRCCGSSDCRAHERQALCWRRGIPLRRPRLLLQQWHRTACCKEAVCSCGGTPELPGSCRLVPWRGHRSCCMLCMLRRPARWRHRH